MASLHPDRVSGSKTSVDALRAELDAGREVDLGLDGNYPDIFVICDVFRQW